MTTFTTRAVALGGALAAAALLSIPGSAAAPKFYDDDPIWHEADTQDASKLKMDDVDLLVDLATNILRQTKPANIRALNVNTVDEVPDSSWFTNRAGSGLPLTAAEIAIGPNTTQGPAAGPWTISSSKSDGVTPGFTVKDSAGRVWFLKFDPPGHRGMATGTEVAVTRLMWALGYNVPENHIASLRPDRLVLGATAKYTTPDGVRRPMRQEDVRTLLSRADRDADGSYRVIASRALDGTPVGRIRFLGTRPDDPNDVVAHQHRRELRGYRVFAAWLNHVDAKAINSLDTLVHDGGTAHVRHNLLDFGSTLGSGGIGPADYSQGQEYLVEPRETLKRMVGFGFVIPRWRTAAVHEAPSIGRIAADNTGFDPDRWKPRVPNQAFLQARADDNFWAARKLAAITTELITAAVREGDFGDPAAEAILVRALSERRDAILRAYLTAVNPIEAPSLDSAGSLTVRNAAVDADVAKAPASYRAEWWVFDNATQSTAYLGRSEARTSTLAAPVPLPRTPGAFIKVRVSAVSETHPSWAIPVDAYFRLRDGAWGLVGFERMP